jgi:putative DNA primase/helicase
MDKQKILNNLNIADFYKRLIPSLKVNGRDEAAGCCQFHDDHNPSMSINIKTGLYHCHVCGAGGDIFNFYMRVKDVDFSTALREIGKIAGVVESDTKPKVVATFKYADEKGNLLYIKERVEPGRNGKSKEFFFKYLNDGKWVFGRNGDPVLYRLPEIIKSKYCFIVEGEGKVDLLNSWGLTATCLDSGSNSPIKDEYIQILGSMEKVIILPDNDEPGRNYAYKFANLLHGKVNTLKVVELPGLKESEDAIDWARNAGKEKLVEIIENTSVWVTKECDKHILTIPQHPIKVSTIQDMLQYERPEYLVKPIIYQKTVNLLTSLPGVGKSISSFSIAAGVASNKEVWGHFPTLKNGRVLIIDEENPGSIHRSRIEKMGIDKDTPIHFIHYQSLKVDNPKHLEALIKLINEKKYVLVIFDALIRLHHAKENDADEMAKVMQAFRELIKQTDTTVLIIHHERKSRDGERRERSRGSGDIVGAIDCQLVLEEGGEMDNGKALILYPGKTRLASFTPIRLAFNSDTLEITYVADILSSKKSIIQSIVQFIGDGIKDFEEIQQSLNISEKQLRTILKNALGKELILDSTLKNNPEYRGSPRKQFYKLHPNYVLSNVAMFPPIGGETCHIEESQPHREMQPGNMESLDFAECGVVAEHGLPHCHNEKKYVSDEQKKVRIGNIENATKTNPVNSKNEPINLDALGVEL